MTSPRHIAPARPSTITAPTTPTATAQRPAKPPVAANDVIFVNGQPFNGRGYPVCGVANQRGRLCGRIGTCPFHAQQKAAATPKRPRSPNHSSQHPQTQPRHPKQPRVTANVRQMAIPPQKARFKRSWTTEEHCIFLQAMRRHGKGKWKEIAGEVKTRTANQCQSHAQKFFLRQAKTDAERKKKSIHDVTEKDVIDNTWNSLQTPSRPALVAQKKQQDAAATAIAPALAPAQSSTPATATYRVSTSSGPVSIIPRDHSDATSRSLTPNAIPSTAATPNGIAQVSQPSHSSLHPSGVTNLTITVPSNPTNPSAVFPTSSSGATTTSLPVVHSGASTVPVVVPMSGVGIQYGSMVPSFLHPGMGNASNAAIVAPPPPAKLRVTVHVNGRLKGGMALMLPSVLDDFFDMASTKLQFEGSFSRVFTRSGGEITSLDEMCQDDMLWLSTGEDFLTPR